MSALTDTTADIDTSSGSTAPVWSLAAALLGFFMVTMDAVIVNVALPDIRRELAGGITGLQWVADGYTLMFAALLLSALMIATGLAGPLVMPPVMALPIPPTSERTIA